jgi:hypothetical protein
LVAAFTVVGPPADLGIISEAVVQASGTQTIISATLGTNEWAEFGEGELPNDEKFIINTPGLTLHGKAVTYEPGSAAVDGMDPQVMHFTVNHATIYEADGDPVAGVIPAGVVTDDEENTTAEHVGDLDVTNNSEAVAGGGGGDGAAVFSSALQWVVMQGGTRSKKR